MNVPIVDVEAQYASSKPEVAAAIDDALERTSFIIGPVGRFEEGYARFVGTR